MLRLTILAALILLAGCRADEPAPTKLGSDGFTPEQMRTAEAQRKAARRAQGYAKPDRPDGYDSLFVSLSTPLGEQSAAPPANYRVNATRAMDAAPQARVRTLGKNGVPLSFESVGPGNVGGRTRALMVDRNDASGLTWIAGGVGGGLWRTTDAGASWTHLTAAISALAVTAIAQSVSSPDVIYVGTGEGFGNTDAIRGDGLFKSVDGGATWSQLASTTGEDFDFVNRVLADPANANVVVAAANEGLFRSTDGGASWTKTLTPGNSRVQQVITSSGSFQTQFATLNGIGIQLSTNGGASWQVSLALDDATTGRIELAASPSNSNVVYASVESTDRATNGDVSLLYVTRNGGGSWQRLATSSDDWLSGQGWYDNTIAVHPTNDRRVFVGGVNLFRVDVPSSGTASVTRLTNWYPGERRPGGGVYPYIHADQHSLTLLARGQSAAGFRMIATNDGGIFTSDDEGASWREATGGYRTTQFYDADRARGTDVYIGGTQDNGTWTSPTSPRPTSAWSESLGGDGFGSVIHGGDSNKRLGSLYYNRIYRTVDGGRTWREGSEGGVEEGGGFITEIGQSDTDPDLVFATTREGIWRSDDFAQTWQPSVLTDPASWFRGNSRNPVDVSPVDPRVVWAASFVTTFGDRVQRSTDGGATFSPTAPVPFDVSLAVSGLSAHTTDPNSAFLTLSSFGRPKVFRTSDGGASWQNLTGTFTRGNPLSSNGFPDVRTFDVLTMPDDPSEIWAATEIGIVVSTNGGVTWTDSPYDLPRVSVWQMRLVDDKVVLATHGLGVWSATLGTTFAPPAVTLAPRLSLAAQAPSGSLSLAYDRRSAYDSVAVSVDGSVVAWYGANAAPTARERIALTLPVQTARTARFQVVGYRGGEAYPSAAVTVALSPARAPVVSYANDADAGSALDDFAASGFTRRSLSGFSSDAFHTAHPYADGDRHSLTLMQPIRVAASNAILSYRDVALIEPGANGTRYGDGDFYDYVIVEGTSDGVTWRPLAPGYDARAHSAWESAYDSGANGSSALMRDQRIDLLGTFAAGDTILVRFRLWADGGVAGWGWAIDDLEIQPSGVSVATGDDAQPTAFALHPIAPNPVRGSARLSYDLPTSAHVRVEVYDASGRLVLRPVNQMESAGARSALIDASDLPAGTYFARVTAGHFVRTRTLTVVR